jgi:hypothetical protein
MPRLVAIVLVLLGFATVNSAPAQRRELTLLFGGTVSGATGSNLDKTRSRSGFAGGLSLRLPRTPQFSFETQLLVVQRRVFGQRAPTTLPPLAAGPFSDAASLGFLEIPLLLRFQRGYSRVRPVRPYLTLGPYLGVRVGCRRELTDSDGNRRKTDCSVAQGSFTTGSETYLPAVYQEVDVGILGGVGVELRSFTVGARFERSFRNLVEPAGGVHTSPFDSARLWTAMFSLEYLIRVI